MDAIRNVVSPREDDSVRLSKAQKRDIMGMAAAAVITAGLIAAPGIAPRDDTGTLLIARSIRSVSNAPLLVATRFETPAVSHVQAPAVSRMPSRGASATRRLDTPSPSWSARAVRTPAVVAVTARVEMNARMDASRKPLARRLAGFFTGDGTHAIRPFPTVPSER
jgi:hypothetical protein